MEKFSYKFKATNNEFMYISFIDVPYNPNCLHQTMMHNIVVLAKKYRMTENDINLMPFVKAQKFPQLQEDDYTFIIETDYEFDEAMMKEHIKCFESLCEPVKETDYLYFITSIKYNLIRIKTILLPYY